MEVEGEDVPAVFVAVEHRLAGGLGAVLEEHLGVAIAGEEDPIGKFVLPNYVFSDKVTTPIVKAKYGDSSGVRGLAVAEALTLPPVQLHVGRNQQKDPEENPHHAHAQMAVLFLAAHRRRLD